MIEVGCGFVCILLFLHEKCNFSHCDSEFFQVRSVDHNAIVQAPHPVVEMQSVVGVSNRDIHAVSPVDGIAVTLSLSSTENVASLSGIFSITVFPNMPGRLAK